MANNGVVEPHLQPTPAREPIYCRCCGTAILAERVEDAIVIKTRRNGKFHVAVVQCPRVRSCWQLTHYSVKIQHVMETNTRRIRQRLGRDGWYLARHGRKHDIYWHAEIRAAIKVPRHTKVSPGVARDIAKVAGWEV